MAASAALAEKRALLKAQREAAAQAEKEAGLEFEKNKVEMAKLQEQAKAFIVSDRRRTREIEEAEERIKRLKQEKAVPFSVNGQVTDPFMFVTEPIE
jgi:hypothetical protein